MYNRLSHLQRYEIFAKKEAGFTNKMIALSLNVSESTISRELKRNRDLRDGKYKPDLAQRKADNRQKDKPHYSKMSKEIIDLIEYYLVNEQWSPEQICNRLRAEGTEMLSHESIYKYIWKDKRTGGVLYKHLRHKGRHYHKRSNKYKYRGAIPNRVDISERPQIVAEKLRFGDLEIDTVIGKNHKGALLTINDRATSYVWICKLNGKEAAPLTQAAINILLPFKDFLHTITADNGREFTNHEKISAALDIKIYFARPYHSWERGANENTNGLIRQYIPKKTSMEDLTDEQILEIQNRLNNRPRKRLNWSTPYEKLTQFINLKNLH